MERLESHPEALNRSGNGSPAKIIYQPMSMIVVFGPSAALSAVPCTETAIMGTVTSGGDVVARGYRYPTAKAKPPRESLKG
jgi:hypothetical protein